MAQRTEDVWLWSECANGHRFGAKSPSVRLCPVCGTSSLADGEPIGPSPPDRLGITREEVAAKLADMRLHDETGDPHDEGFIAAVVEFEEWLKRGS